MLCTSARATDTDDGSPDEPGVVVVEGARTGPGTIDETATVTVIEVDERLPRGATVTDALQRVAGAQIVQLGGLGDFSAVGIRGASLRQVQVYIDGVPLNPDGQQVVNLAELPLLGFERVEVYRGGAPARFAAAPIGGVINLVTPQEPGDTPRMAQVTAGSTDVMRLSALGHGAVEARGVPVEAMAFAELFHTSGAFVAFSDNGTPYNRLDDQRQPRGNNDKAQLSTTARVRVGRPGRRLTLQDTFLSRDEGLPSHANAPADAVRLETTRNLAVAQLDAGAGLFDATGRVWHQARIERYDDRAGEIGTGSQWTDSAFSSVGALGHVAWSPGPHAVPALTLQGRRDAASLTDLLIDEAGAPRVRWSGTAAMSADLYAWGERVRVTPVAQGMVVDNRALGDDPIDDSPIAPAARQMEAAFTPRLGVRVRPTPAVAVRASAGRFVRPPDLTELFGDRGARAGNPGLVPETGWQWDVGAGLRLPDHPAGAASLDVTHFWTSVADHIITVQNSQRTSVPVNFGQTWTQGLEVALDLSLLGALDSQTAVTGTLSRNLTRGTGVANNQLPRVPRRQVSQATSVHWRERARLGHTWTFVSGNYWDATNWFEAPPRNLHGAFARVTPAPDLGFSLEASVLNLLDRTAEVVDRNPLDPADRARALQPVTDFVGYPLAGRTWLVSVRWAG